VKQFSGPEEELDYFSYSDSDGSDKNYLNEELDDDSSSDFSSDSSTFVDDPDEEEK